MPPTRFTSRTGPSNISFRLTSACSLVALLTSVAAYSAPKALVELVQLAARQGEWGDLSHQRLQERLTIIMTRVNRCLAKNAPAPILTERMVVVSLSLHQDGGSAVTIKHSKNECNAKHDYSPLDECIKRELSHDLRTEGSGARGLSFILRVNGKDPVCKKLLLKRRQPSAKKHPSRSLFGESAKTSTTDAIEGCWRFIKAPIGGDLAPGNLLCLRGELLAFIAGNTILNRIPVKWTKRDRSERVGVAGTNPRMTIALEIIDTRLHLSVSEGKGVLVKIPPIELARASSLLDGAGSPRTACARAKRCQGSASRLLKTTLDESLDTEARCLDFMKGIHSALSHMKKPTPPECR